MTLCYFCLPIVPYHTEKFRKKKYCQWIQIVQVLVLGSNYPFVQKGSFLEILLMGFLFTYYVYLAEEFLKNSTEQTLRHKLPQFGDRFGPKMATLHQNGNVF